MLFCGYRMRAVAGYVEFAVLKKKLKASKRPDLFATFLSVSFAFNTVSLVRHSWKDCFKTAFACRSLLGGGSTHVMMLQASAIWIWVLNISEVKMMIKHLGLSLSFLQKHSD